MNKTKKEGKHKEKEEKEGNMCKKEKKKKKKERKKNTKKQQQRNIEVTIPTLIWRPVVCSIRKCIHLTETEDRTQAPWVQGKWFIDTYVTMQIDHVV